MRKYLLWTAAVLLVLPLTVWAATSQQGETTTPVEVTMPSASEASPESVDPTDSAPGCGLLNNEEGEPAADLEGRDPVLLSDGPCDDCFATFQSCFQGCSSLSPGYPRISCKNECVVDQQQCCQQNGCCATHGCCP